MASHRFKRGGHTNALAANKPPAFVQAYDHGAVFLKPKPANEAAKNSVASGMLADECARVRACENVCVRMRVH